MELWRDAEMTKIEKTEIIIEVEKCDDCDNHFGCQCMLTADHKDIDDCFAYPPVWCPLPDKPEGEVK
jgi:hypothetical protein